MKNTDNLILLAQQIINQSQYDKLYKLDICNLDKESQSINAEDVLCLFKITEIVYNENDVDIDKFSIVFSALHSCGASCIMILECVEGKTELYLGAVNKKRYQNIYYLNIIRDILKTSIYGNLPGCEMKEVISRKDIKKILYDTLDNGFDSQCITSISCVADLSKSNINYGMETLLSAVRENNFSIIVIADPVSNEEIEFVKKGYQDLGTELSALENLSVTVQSGNNYTASENISTSFNKSLTRGITLTQTHSISGTYKKEKEQDEKKSEKNNALLKLGAGATIFVGTGGNIGASFLAMNAIEQVAKYKQNTVSIRQGNEQYYSQTPDNISDVIGKQQGLNINQQQGQTDQFGTGKSLTQIDTTSIQSTTKDLYISQLNDKLNKYINWLNKVKNDGMFSCCTYVISGSASTNLFVAGQYKALIQSYGESQQPISINTWTKENEVEKIRNYLLHLMHPNFKLDENIFSSAMLVSSNELSKQMSLPKKSILGVSVTNHASFGIEVVRKSLLSNGSLIKIGQVQHMSKSTGQPVLLDLQSLSSHTFIAGTNGSGKSNTVFKMIEELLRLKLPFMVIEPAKGEYKNYFGNDADINVYGTNPKKTKLLNINPFWFNEDVNINEHIDKIVEIFNASWSMYAAMPSILKSCINNAYKSYGWNLKTSECLGNKKFPTFKDVLLEFNKKMKSTAFSEEVKGNYIGALSTRMEALCNGIYEQIFIDNDMGDKSLFDSNVIIDLSRVGSSETKSIIMGFLVVRLQEYRMKNEALNLPLKHITVLEEAHHLLRRTSSVQSDDSSNILGKSVEMISNMIAEMRSYGEGFIIVDQSPGLLDMSVLRNTNTKIIMRLLENNDRELVGNTIGLNTEQKNELFKLQTGVCAIYQKEWLQPVLCLIDKAHHNSSIYCYTPDISKAQLKNDIKKARGIAFETLTPLKKNSTNPNEDEINLSIKTLETSNDFDKILAKLLKEYLKTKEIRQKGVIKPYSFIIWNLLDGDNIWEFLFSLIKDNNIKDFDLLLREEIDKNISCNNETKTALINLFLQEKGKITQVYDFYYKWAWKFMLNKQ